MSGGQPNSNNPGQHVWIRDGSMISPDEYRRNQQQLIQYRDMLARMEQENDDAYLRYTRAERELESRVSQGREAERILAQIRSRTTQTASVPLLTMASHASNGTSNGTSNGCPPSQYHNGEYGAPAVGAQGGEFVQGSSRTAHGASQPQVQAPYYPSAPPPGYPPPPHTSYYAQQYPAQQPQAHRSAYPTHGNSNGQQPYDYPPPSNTTAHDHRYGPPQRPHYSAAPLHAHASAPTRPEQHPQSARASSPRPSGRTGESQSRAASGEQQLAEQQTARTHNTTAAVVAEAKRQAAVAEGRIYETVKTLPLPTVLLIFRVVIDSLKHRLKTADGTEVELPGVEDAKHLMTPIMTQISEHVIANLQSLPGTYIVGTLQRVQAQCQAQSEKTKTPASQPAATLSGQQTTQPHTEPARAAGPSVPPPPTPVAKQNGANHLQPAQTAYHTRVPLAFAEVRPPHESNGVVHQSQPKDMTTLQLDMQSQGNAPSVSFSNLAPSTPQPNGVGPSFTPGRLAHDILKSLGKPSGRTPAGTPTPAVAPGSKKDTQAKRKRAASSANSTEKRRRTDADTGADSSFQSASEATVDSPARVPTPPAPKAASKPSEPIAQAEPAMAVVEEPEEIHTPGVIESALNEALAALPNGHPVMQELGSPMRDAPPIQDSGISISSPQSGASLPPSSKVTTPEREVAPQHDSDVDMIDNAPKTPVAGPSKQPLFYVSPTASNEDRDARPDFDEAMSDFVPSGLLDGDTPISRKGKGSPRKGTRSPRKSAVSPRKNTVSPRKGKGRARQDDSEDEVALKDTDNEVVFVESSEPDEVLLVLPNARAKMLAKRGLRRAYVLVPPPSEALQKLRRILKGGKREEPHGTRVVGRVVVTSDDDSDDVDEIAEDFRDEATQQKEASEARVVQDLCYNRHKASNCRWSNCTAILESAKRLGLHARTHAFEHDDADIYACSWEGCPREYKSKERLAHHVQKHSLHPVTCAYAGCDFECWAARDMVMHHKQPRHRGQPLKPDAGPVAPDLNVIPPLMPETLPSYMAVPRPIRPARISQERHATLAPKIAANLSTWTPFGEVSESTSLRTPRRPKLSEKLVASLESGEMRSASTAGSSKGKQPVRGPYDHWLQPAALRRVRRLCDDIPSRAVTDMFAKGLVIDNDWLERGDPEWEYHEQDADGVTDDEEDMLPFEEIKPEDRGGEDAGGRKGPEDPAGDGASAVAEKSEELHTLRTLADGASQQPGWEVLPDASEE